MDAGFFPSGLFGPKSGIFSVVSCRLSVVSSQSQRIRTQSSSRSRPPLTTRSWPQTTIIGPDRSPLGGMDGIATAAEAQAHRRGGPRTSGPHPSCIPNRWDSNGKPTAAPAISSACRTRASRSRRLASTNQFSHFAAQVCERSLQHGFSRIDDHVPPRPEPLQLQPYGLARPPADAIARHRRTQCARRRESDAHAGGPLRILYLEAKCREESPRESPAAIVDAPEIPRAKYTAGFRK
jgi:hypothetical protein